MSIVIRNCLFKYKCTKKWHELTRTEVEGRRFCPECERMVFFCNSAEDLGFELRLNNCVAIIKHGSSKKYASPQDIPGYDGPDHMEVWRTPKGSALFRKMLHGTPLEEEDRKTLEHIKGLNRTLQYKK